MTRKEKLYNLKNSYILNNPNILYSNKKQEYVITLDKLNNNILNIKNHYDNKYINLINKLEVLNPLLTIKRGYAITKKNNKVITSIKDIKKDDKLTLELSDGIINTKVI